MSRLLIVEDTYENGVSVRRPVHVQTWETDEDMQGKLDELNEHPDARYNGCYDLVELP